MTPIQILTEVRDLFQDRSKWTNYFNARDAAGRPVEPDDPTATCWCVNGGIALKSVGFNELYQATYQFLKNFGDHIEINDHLGYDAVITLLNRALTYEISPASTL